MEPRPADAWKQVRTARASEGVAEQITRAFFDGMTPGDWIGTESELAQRFGVSRTTVRDAIRTLEVRGIVEVKMGSGGGLRVAGADPDRVIDALSVQLHLAGVEWLEVVEAMQAVEPLTARLAATRAEPAEIDRMRRAVAAAADRTGDPHAFTESSLDFHLLVAEGSHNRALRASVRALRSAQVPKFERNSSRARARGVTSSHERILTAIEAGDADGAEEAMAVHLASMTRDPSADDD